MLNKILYSILAKINKIITKKIDNILEEEVLKNFNKEKYSIALNRPNVGKKCSKITGINYDYSFCRSGDHEADCFNIEKGIAHHVLFTLNKYSTIKEYTSQEIKDKEFLWK